MSTPTVPPAASACPRCGAARPPEAPPTLCPACLLRQALASRTMPDPAAPAGDTPPPPPTPGQIADKFPGFEILDCLGRGGMGVVYRVRQKSLDRLVALKILAPERVGRPDFAARFAREARTLARLNHPNIVTVFDYGETDGLFYIVMEFVDGVNLRDLLHDGRLAPQQALAIVPPLCEALQYAHDQGVVHRDIKPENLLLDRAGRIKIADFGIAALVGAAGGERAGTPPYMAPEQGDAANAIDHRADIYALGVVLYEMLTGERPGPGLLPPATKKSGLEPRLDAVLRRALDREPARRFPTAGALGDAIQPLVNPARAHARRARRIALGLALGLFVSASVWVVRADREINPHRIQWIRARLGRPHAAEDGRFIARLPNGGSVEILAVRLHPSADPTWWRPDGTPSDFDPAIQRESEGWKGLSMEALTRINHGDPKRRIQNDDNTTSHENFEIYYPLDRARLHGRLVPFEDYAVLNFRNPPDFGNYKTRLSLDVSPAGWQTLATQKPGWLASLPYALRGRAWTFSTWAGDALMLTVPDLVADADYDFEFVGVDHRGGLHRLDITTETYDGEKRTSVYKSNAAADRPALRLADVAEVRLRARPRESIVFDRVSLRPGNITTVKISDYPPSPAASAAP